MLDIVLAAQDSGMALSQEVARVAADRCAERVNEAMTGGIVIGAIGGMVGGVLLGAIGGWGIGRELQRKALADASSE